MKISVYAICKNEIGFLERWFDSMREADCVCVLDTGSTDGTWERLCTLSEDNARLRIAREIVTPWRFDRARNDSLLLIPPDTDICVCTDIDEFWSGPWRKPLEEAWQPGTEQARYRCVWDGNSFESASAGEGTTMLADKIHAPDIFGWTYPVHEVLTRTDGKTAWPTVRIEGISLLHRPDKTKSRAQYLPLLELAADEKPQDARSAHYLGREYLYCSRYAEAISELEQHLSLPSAVWAEERCASMRFIARCYTALGERQEAGRWLLRACAEAPHLREPWVEAEENAYFLGDPEGAAYFGKRAVSIETRPEGYICEREAWGAKPWDLLCVAAYQTGDIKTARSASERAFLLSPGDKRIRGNYELLNGNSKKGYGKEERVREQNVKASH